MTESDAEAHAACKLADGKDNDDNDDDYSYDDNTCSVCRLAPLYTADLTLDRPHMMWF